jgi:hypothetical protein
VKRGRSWVSGGGPRGVVLGGLAEGGVGVPVCHGAGGVDAGDDVEVRVLEEVFPVAGGRGTRECCQSPVDAVDKPYFHFSLASTIHILEPAQKLPSGLFER